MLTSMTYLYVTGTVTSGRNPQPVPSGSGSPAGVIGRLAAFTRRVLPTQPRTADGLVVVGPMPARSTQLDAAVCAELSRRPGLRYGELAGAPSVRAAAEAVRERLRVEGAFPSGVTRLVRISGQLVAVAIGVCGLSLGLFSMSGRSPGGELSAFLLVGVGVCTYVLVGRTIQDKQLSIRAEAALKQLRKGIPPRMKATAWPTIGAPAAGLIVALYGGDAIWKSDPDFAAAAGVPVPSSGNSSSDSGGGDSSSFSCGGGAFVWWRLLRQLFGWRLFMR
ncbi:DUF2207 domain-containing protein [Fodinicola feengrottensis]|uniref:hypothetical protein n=1 Tax=Fodinicola feengrottensis TaxID=435914 RepID=UPI0024411373|nr:hypothetical protein [Fodinicola feengrottensis]